MASSSTYAKVEGSTPSPRPASDARSMWTPLPLKRRAMVAFFSTFLLSIVGLEIVYNVSKQNGFGPTNSSMHYLWTYGPTAYLTVIAAFWSQVDYRSRQMQPWAVLSGHNGQPAETTLLLDYVSANPLFTFFKSIRQKHWPVTMSILGTLLLKAMIVFSTTLFILHSQTIDRKFDFISNTSFNAVHYNSSLVEGIPAMIAVGSLTQNTKPPPWTNDLYAVQPFYVSPSNSVTGPKLQANVPAFSAGLDCEEGKLVGSNQTCPTGSCLTIEVRLNISSPTCQLIPTSRANFLMSGPSADGSVNGVAFSSNCSGSDPDPYRIAIFYGRWAGPKFVKRKSADQWKPVQSIALVCKPLHSLTSSDVQVDGGGELLAVNEGKTRSVVTGLFNATLGEAVLTSLNNATILGNRPRSGRDLPKSMWLDNFFESMLAIMQPQNASTALEDLAFLESSSQRLFRLLSVQVANQYFQSNSTRGTSSLTGISSTPEQRLFVRPLALRSLEGILVALLAVTVALGFFAPRNKTPRDPASIGGLAVVLKSSHEIMSLFKGTGPWPKRRLHSRLTGAYRSQYTAGKFTVSTTNTEDTNNPDAENSADVQHEPKATRNTADSNKSRPIQEPASKRSGRPILTKRVSRVVLIVTAIILILIIEILYQHSRRNNGIGNAPISKTSQYSWAYLPALVMVAYQLFYSAVDFEVRVYSPYLRLNRGNATARESILDNALPKVSLHAMWSAFRRNDSAVALSALGLFISTGLTIAVSGLYTSEAIPATSAVTASAVDSFSVPQFSSRLQGLDMETRLSAFLLQNDQIGDPLWTSGHLALPKLAMPTGTAASPPLRNITSLRVTLPAQRARPNCSIVPRDQITPNRTFYNHNDTDVADYTISWPMLKTSDCQMVNLGSLKTGGQNYEPWGGITSWFGAWSMALSRDNKCPTSFAVWGKWDAKDKDKFPELSVVMCWSGIEEVQTLVELSVPDWKVLSTKPDESRVKLVGQDYNTQLDLNLQGAEGKSNQNRDIDPVFLALIRSPGGSADTDLLKNDNAATLVAKLEDYYKRVSAQVISGEARATNGTLLRFSAEATDSGHSRIVQSTIATRILEAFLAAIVLCALLQTVTLNFDAVSTTTNPSSIAGVASLLAGSSLMEMIPDDSSSLTDGQLQECFEGRVFSLAYRGQWFGIDVDEAERQEKSASGIIATLYKWCGKANRPKLPMSSSMK